MIGLGRMMGGYACCFTQAVTVYPSFTRRRTRLHTRTHTHTNVHRSPTGSRAGSSCSRRRCSRTRASPRTSRTRSRSVGVLYQVAAVWMGVCAAYCLFVSVTGPLAGMTDARTVALCLIVTDRNRRASRNANPPSPHPNPCNPLTLPKHNRR